MGCACPLSRLTEKRDRYGNISSALAFDDVTGMTLEAGKVKEARSKEIQYVRDMRVYDKIPRSMATSKGWKIIKTMGDRHKQGGRREP